MLFRFSGYKMMVYVCWPSIATDDIPVNFVLNHCFWLHCVDMKFSLQIWVYAQQHRHLLHCLQIFLNILYLSRPSLHYLPSQIIPPSNDALESSTLPYLKFVSSSLFLSLSWSILLIPMITLYLYLHHYHLTFLIYWFFFSGAEVDTK